MCSAVFLQSVWQLLMHSRGTELGAQLAFEVLASYVMKVLKGKGWQTLMPNKIKYLSACLAQLTTNWLVLIFQSSVMSGRQQEFLVFLLLFVNKLPLPFNCTCCAGNRVVYNSTSTWGDNGETAKYPGRKECS